MPRRARVWLDRYLDLWQGHADSNAWKEEWWELSRALGDGFGRLLGAPANTVWVQANASVAMSTVASCLDYAERPRIVTTGLEFPSTEYIWREQERLGACLDVIASHDGIRTPVDELLDHIDDRTSLVVLSHASFLSSHLIEPALVVERAHDHGARVLLDVYQTAGALPLDVGSWGVDFAVGGTIKWLCGGPSCGYLYVREDVANLLRPRITGWIAHEEPFAFRARSDSPGGGRTAVRPRDAARSRPLLRARGPRDRRGSGSELHRRGVAPANPGVRRLRDRERATAPKPRGLGRATIRSGSSKNWPGGASSPMRAPGSCASRHTSSTPTTRSKRPRRPCWSCSDPAFLDCGRPRFLVTLPRFFAVSKRCWGPILQGGVERMPRSFGALIVCIAIAGVACSTDNPSGATATATPVPTPTPEPTPTPIAQCTLPAMPECGGPETSKGVFGCCREEEVQVFVDQVAQAQTAVRAPPP